MLGSTTRRMVAARRLHGLIALAAILALGTGVAVAESKFFIQGARLTKQPNGSWKGPGTLDGVKGTLTLTGTIVLLKQQTHKIRFRWTSGKRLVAGCAFNQVLTRPHGVQLWQGSGQITKTSKQERKYKNIHVSLNGPTKRDDLKHAKISIGGPAKSHPGEPTRDC